MDAGTWRVVELQLQRGGAGQEETERAAHGGGRMRFVHGGFIRNSYGHRQFRGQAGPGLGSFGLFYMLLSQHCSQQGRHGPCPPDPWVLYLLLCPPGLNVC